MAVSSRDQPGRTQLRKKRFLRVLGFVALDDVSLEPLSTSIDPEVLAELAGVDRALRDMTAEERIVWVLRHVDGCSMPEIAAHLDRSLSTTKRRLASADARVSRLVDPQKEPP